MINCPHDSFFGFTTCFILNNWRGKSMFQNRTLTHDISSHFFLSYKVVSGDTYFPLMLRQKYFVYMEGRKTSCCKQA